jgi:hypothetical protein
MVKIEKYSFGMGDRFARQGKAQLAAVVQANEAGASVVPVWNKSHREHTTIGTAPADVRAEADAAVAALGWAGSYYIDADHVSLGNVEEFLAPSNFFTIDVADYIGRTAPDEDIAAFVTKYAKYIGELTIPNIDEPVRVTRDLLEGIAQKFLLAVQEGAKLYQHIAAAKGADNFVTEVSMDETDLPQTPVDMLFILAALADAGVPVQTIAPRFPGRFNKGVDYVGDVAEFTRDFERHLAVIAYAVETFGLPDTLKLSVHSGSDKFALYASINASTKKYNAGLHIKTAGTTWLEELIGLACAGGDGLELAKEVYRTAHGRLDELTGPYASVINVDPTRLPAPDDVDGWSSAAYAAALRHDATCEAYNADLRQLLHVGYKVAAEMETRYTDALATFEESVSENVCGNLFERHLRPLFL